MDSYEILGIQRNATYEQIRTAYRDKARLYANDPDMMKKLDLAYDEVINSASAQNTTESGNTDYSYNYSAFTDIRNLIDDGNYNEAQRRLDETPDSMKNAEWFYLSGVVNQRKGWLNEAFNCFENAVRLDENNGEYASAYNNMKSARSGGYRTTSDESKSGGCGFCDVCSGLLCADCLCESCGGDLIPCC